MQKIALTVEQINELSDHVTNHLHNCFKTMGSTDKMFITEGGEVFEPYGKFCGCRTCLIREQLMATFGCLKSLGVADIIISNES
jgi:hypothetical protein